MTLAMVSSFRSGIETLVTAVSILGGCMAFYSGLEASRSVRARRFPDQTAHRINKGLARGFGVGIPAALAFSVTLLVT